MSEESFNLNKSLRNNLGFQKHLTPVVLLGLILLLGTALRFYDLGTESYTSDEMYTVVEAQQSVYQLITSGRLDQPPAYYLPLLLWVKIFGTNEVSTRSFSALAGIGSIILVYWIGRELFDKRVGLLSAFLMAISGFQIDYSQTARFYSFFEFTTLLSFLFFALSFRSKRVIHYAMYAMTSILMVYSHAFGVFILAAQNLFFILQWKSVRSVIITWLFCQALIVFAIVPGFYPLVFGGNVVDAALSNTSITPPPLLWELITPFFRFIIPRRFDQSWGFVIASYFIAVAFFVAGTWIYAYRQGIRNWITATSICLAGSLHMSNVTKELILVSCWLLCPILSPFILSWVVAPIYNYRYMISAAPALYLLIALGMLNIRKVMPLMISLGALLIMIAPGLLHYYVADVKEQWKEVARYVEENSKPNDVIVFTNDSGLGTSIGIGIKHESFYWYYKGNLQSCSLNISSIEPDAIIKP
jgi:mannosyltransferase